MTQEKRIDMSPDEYEHNIKVLTNIEKIKTLQEVANTEFMAHKKEDRVHFDRLYDSVEDIEKSISKYAADFRVFQTKILYAVMGAITVGTILGTVLNIFVAGSKLIS